jgi:hypothetical protein
MIGWLVASDRKVTACDTYNRFFGVASRDDLRCFSTATHEAYSIDVGHFLLDRSCSSRVDEIKGQQF